MVLLLDRVLAPSTFAIGVRVAVPFRRSRVAFRVSLGDRLRPFHVLEGRLGNEIGMVESTLIAELTDRSLVVMMIVGDPAGTFLCPFFSAHTFPCSLSFPLPLPLYIFSAFACPLTFSLTFP